MQERRLYEADRTWERADLFLDTTTANAASARRGDHAAYIIGAWNRQT